MFSNFMGSSKINNLIDTTDDQQFQQPLTTTTQPAQQMIGNANQDFYSAVNPYMENYTNTYQGIAPAGGNPMLKEGYEQPEVIYQGLAPGTVGATGAGGVSRSTFGFLDPSGRMEGEGLWADQQINNMAPQQQQMQDSWGNSGYNPSMFGQMF